MKKNIPYEKLLGQQGFTLIEIGFIALIFPVLMISLFSVLDFANVIFNTNDVYSRLNQSAMQVLRSISREIGQSSPNPTPSHLDITQDGTGNSIVQFQIPVDWDNDGDVVTAGFNPNVEWGVYDDVGGNQNGRLNGWARYSVAGGQLIRDVLPAAAGGGGGVPTVTRIIANNVQNFTAAQEGNVLTLDLTLSGTDRIGQSGRQRTIQSTFSNNTILRNAVS